MLKDLTYANRSVANVFFHVVKGTLKSRQDVPTREMFVPSFSMYKG